MRKERHCKKPVGLKRRTVVALASCLAVAALAVGGTLAYLTDEDRAANTFSAGRVTTTVDEKLDGGVKSEVRIQNTGTVDAWIRAEVVITWQDAGGNIYGKVPIAESDYAIEYAFQDLEVFGDASSAGEWVKGTDGFYYWTKPVAPGGYTGELIKTCSYLASKVPEGYSLSVEVLGSGIQDTPSDAFDDWSGEASGLVVNESGAALVKKPA